MKEKQIKKGQMAAIRKHLSKAEAIVRKKTDFLTGRREELGESLETPKDEIKQIMLLIEEAKKYATPELSTLLLALKVDTRQLSESIKKEAELVDKLEKDAKGTSERDILKEIDEEIDLALHLEHQINLLTDIQRLSKEIINKVDTDVKNEEKRSEIGGNLANLNNIASFLLTMIHEEELPQLKIAYNTLQLIEKPELAEKLAKIQSRFENLQPNVL